MARSTLHDPVAKKAMVARLARAEGQVRAIRRMVDRDEECEDIALQLAAARRALDRAFYEMVSCMIRVEMPGGAPARARNAKRVAEMLARFA
ncbi:MAG: metal-sensitive transcriptional regulator [Pseudomonadota bacterium]|nr:metal-sensitive transcriptional regulator [Pseudomonadota bacterium]